MTLTWTSGWAVQKVAIERKMEFRMGSMEAEMVPQSPFPRSRSVRAAKMQKLDSVRIWAKTWSMGVPNVKSMTWAVFMTSREETLRSVMLRRMLGSPIIVKSLEDILKRLRCWDEHVAVFTPQVAGLRRNNNVFWAKLVTSSEFNGGGVYTTVRRTENEQQRVLSEAGDVIRTQPNLNVDVTRMRRIQS